jgi:hypothetical protein
MNKVILESSKGSLPHVVRILSLISKAVENLVKARNAIESSLAMGEETKESLNQMLTESVIEFVDFNYVDHFGENVEGKKL